MKELIRRISAKTVRKFGKFGPGDTVNVSVKVKEGDKERTQIFKGVVIKAQGTGGTRTFTVRKTSFGVGVERTFPYQSPSVENVEVVSRGKVRRAKLYFLRKLAGRAANLESELAFDAAPVEAVAPVSAESAAEKAKKRAAKKEAHKAEAAAAKKTKK